MSTVDIQNIREEICNLLRSSNILTTTIRGATTTTDTYTTAGSTIQLSKTNIKNIRSISVDAVSLTLNKDYTINWATGVITLVTPLVTTSTIVFDTATSEKIYPDMPRDEMTLNSYPRVGIELLNVSSRPFGLGGMSHLSDIALEIICWVPANKDNDVNSGYGGTENLTDLISSIRDKIRQNAKLFGSFSYITPMSSSPIIKSINNKIIQQSMTFAIKFKTEIS
jgi:hypothetical protein